jgi:L-lysine 6-oxidase
MVDTQGRLIVPGAFGKAGGDNAITSFAGADSWHDDISDGPVQCKLTLADGSVQELKARVIVGSPKFAPELVNIVTLDDIVFDVGVRYHNLAPNMYDPKKRRK